MAETTKKLCAYPLATLERELVLGGKTLPAGTTVMLLPQTTAHSVRVPGDMSLAEAWEGLAKAGHGHAETDAALAAYQTQLIRCADRQTKLELWAAANGFTGS